MHPYCKTTSFFFPFFQNQLYMFVADRTQPNWQKMQSSNEIKHSYHHSAIKLMHPLPGSCTSSNNLKTHVCTE